jgi:hypothetical protein
MTPSDAFIWQSIARARLPRLDPQSLSTIARAVDARKYVGVSPTYPGPIQVSTYTTLELLRLAEEPLGIIALNLRSALDPETSDLEFHTRSIATFLSRTPDKTRFSATATLDPSVGIILSSWAKTDCYGLDFGLGLGTPESVRRPRFHPVEGLNFLMPRTSEGGIAVAVCLRDEDMARLREDPCFSKFAKYIG